MLAQRVFDHGGIADVAFDEGESGIVEEIANVGEIAGIGELVIGDEAKVLLIAQEHANEVRTDEPGRAGDEDGAFSAHGKKSNAEAADGQRRIG